MRHNSVNTAKRGQAGVLIMIDSKMIRQAMLWKSILDFIEVLINLNPQTSGRASYILKPAWTGNRVGDKRWNHLKLICQ